MKKLLLSLSFIICCLPFSTALTACADQEGEWFDEPFVRITTPNGTANQVVSSSIRTVGTYTAFLSGPALAENDSVIVSYEIIVGDGLVEDVDYKVVTTQNPLVFLPGINDAPIRVRWLKHTVDPTKDNTLTIRLTSNSKGYTLGFPGPSHIQSQVTIEKRNE